MKIDLNQTDFRRPLYIQMMAFGVVQTSVGLICAPLTLLNRIHSLLTHYPTGTFLDNIEYVIHFTLILALIIPFLWLIAAQLFILNNEFRGNLSKLLIGWIGGLCVFVILLASIYLLDKEATYVIGKIFANPMGMP